MKTEAATATHCPYCAMQCGMNLRFVDEAWAVEARDFPTNRGGMCRKGWTSTKLLAHPNRLTSPLLRRSKNSGLEAVSWDEALDFVANRFVDIQRKHGRDAVGMFGGGGLTNEKAYLLGKFARVALKTRHIDYNGRYCMASAAAANLKAFGLDRGMPFPMQDIARADAVLVIGANFAETMPPIVQWFDEMRERGGKLIVVDPRATPTAKNADFHLQTAPGADIALATALLAYAVEDGFVDEEFIAKRTSGWQCAREVVRTVWPGYAEKMVGIDEAVLREVVRVLAAGNTMILSARGAEQHADGTNTVLSFINLALALGKAGKQFNGYGTLTGQGNGQGGREHGQKADQLPGYRKIENPIHRAEIAKVWNISPDDLPRAGVSAVEMLDAIGTESGIRAMWSMGSNLTISSPNANRVKDKLRELELLVVSDLFLSETAQFADVVFPVTQWAEEEGTMTNLEGRVLHRAQAKKAPEGVKSDLQVMAALADRLGEGDKFPSAPRAVWEELRRATEGAPADYSGISYERIDAQDGVFWPCARGKHDTPRMFLDQFGFEDGRARFHEIEWWGRAEEPDSQFPLFFTTGRTMAHYQSGTQTRRVKELDDAVGPAYVEIHPDLAREIGALEGNSVRVSSRRGEAFGVARLSESIRPDTLFMPFHWGGQNCANALTLNELDPTSRMPEFKVCAAKIEKATDDTD